ncbi:MAG: glycosyltransferase family 4 protein [Actinobacteria bacterium]|nr:glycosyltransferase family 4 protein [Actinomycetota bacterium]
MKEPTSHSPAHEQQSFRLVIVAEQLRRRVPGGIGTYAQGLLQGLSSCDVQLEVLASRPHEDLDPLARGGWVLRYLPDHLPLSSQWLSAAWNRGVYRQVVGCELVHATSFAFPGRISEYSRSRYTARGGARGSIVYPPLSIMVHDLAWRRYPGMFTNRGRRWHERALRRAISMASCFVVPSNTVADDLVAGGASASLIHVIGEGCDHMPDPDLDGTARLLEAIGVHEEYILTVGTLEPRKNLAGLLLAYSDARDKFAVKMPLVVVGPYGWGEQMEAVDGVIMAGPQPAPILAGLYARARVLVYVPYYEGFGLPPLEAMSMGAPVVASKVPSVSGVALEVDPGSTGSIAEGLIAVCNDNMLRDDLASRGRQFALGQTWEKAAKAHVEVWREMLDPP